MSGYYQGERLAVNWRSLYRDSINKLPHKVLRKQQLKEWITDDEMGLACQILFEVAGRRQDLLALKYENIVHTSDQGVDIKFWCVKNSVWRKAYLKAETF